MALNCGSVAPGQVSPRCRCSTESGGGRSLPARHLNSLHVKQSPCRISSGAGTHPQLVQETIGRPPTSRLSYIRPHRPESARTGPPGGPRRFGEPPPEPPPTTGPGVIPISPHGPPREVEGAVPRPRRAARRGHGGPAGALRSGGLAGLEGDPGDPLHARGGRSGRPAALAPHLPREALPQAGRARGGAGRPPRPHVREGGGDGPRPSPDRRGLLPPLPAGGGVLRVLSHAGQGLGAEEAHGRGASRVHPR